MSSAHEFREAIESFGLTPPVEVIPDGRIHRFAPYGKSKKQTSWYVFHNDGIPAGCFGDWRTGRKRTWHANVDRRLTKTEREQHRARVEKMKKEREADETIRHEQARENADRIWGAAVAATDDHPYLKTKGVQSHGLREHEGMLLVPMSDGAGLCSLQMIGPDGNKRFLTGGRVQGCHFIIGTLARAKKTGKLCIAEGFATAATINEATGLPVVVAFNAGNLKAVTLAVHMRLPRLRLIICADDDAGTEGNPGITRATEAAHAGDGIVAIPDFSVDRPQDATDFNDMAKRFGMDAVKAVIAKAAEPTGSPELKPEAIEVNFASYFPNDDGNARRLIALFGDDMRYCHEFKKWLIWNGQRWVLDGTGRAFDYGKRAMIKFLEQVLHRDNSDRFAIKSIDVKRIEALLKMAQSDLPITSKELDAHPYLLNFQNGTVDLRTGTLMSHRREDLLTKLVHCDYRPDARCPQFVKFLLRILGDGTTRAEHKRALRMLCYLRRCLGYSVTGVTTEKAVFILLGSGDNGKTTLLQIVRLLFDEYSTPIQIESIMTTDRQHMDNNVQSDLADLRGARFAITSESEKGQRLSEARLKRITQGRGMIKVARKYENQVSFVETHKLWIEANHRPVVQGKDNAIWNRLHLILFDAAIPKREQVKDFAERIVAEEGEGIGAFIVGGAIQWNRAGLRKPLEVDRANAQWRKDSSSRVGFVAERCVFIDGKRCTVSAMRQAYDSWCEQNAETPLSAQDFNQLLTEKGAVQPKHSKWVDGDKARVWMNVELKQLEQEQVGTGFS